MSRTNRSRGAIGWAAVLAALAMGIGVARGATYYVDSSWTGASSGTTNAPFTTLAAAAVAYTNGVNNIILVAGGLYTSISEGGLENFGTNGYNLAAKAGSWKGGYAGWLGGTSFDWTEATRTFPNAAAIDSATMTVISLTNAYSRAFTSSGADHVLTFDGFVFRDSNVTAANYDGGALYLNGGMSAAVLYNCVFVNNRTTRNGGGAWYGGRGSTSTNVVCIGNATGTNGFGGGLYVQAGNTGQNFADCRFIGNTAKNGGGMGTGDSQTFTLTRCRFEGNLATLYGGAVGVGLKSIINGRQCRFTGNSAGRGSALGNTGTYSGIGVNLDNCLVAGNAATNEGYAIYVEGSGDTASTMTMRHSTFVTNLAGGIYFKGARSNENSTFTLQNTIVAGNTSNGVFCNMPVNSFAKWGEPLGRPRIGNSILFGNGSNIAWAGEAGTTYSVTNLVEVDPAFADGDAGDFRLAKGSPAVDVAPSLGLTVDLDGTPRPTRLGYEIGAYEEWQIPIITNCAPVADSGSAEVRAQFVYENTGIVTYAWFVLDTLDKGTNMGDWGASSNSGPQSQGVIFGAVFTGLTPGATYAYRCMASNEYDVWWGPASTFKAAAAGGVTRVWTGLGTNRLASNGGNWLGGVAPGAADYVLLDSSSTTMIWNAAATPAVARWTQTENFSGIVTVETVYGSSGFTNFAVTGDCIVNGGTLTHRKNAATEQYRLKMTVAGDLTVGLKGRISGLGVGYNNNSGPGIALYQISGASHGGQGSRYTNVLGITYGSITEPVTLGTGGLVGGPNDGHGGGALYLVVNGITAVDGTLDANAFPSTSSASAGAGGSVFLKTGSLTGTGKIQANGDKQGGGGRVAVILTGSTSFDNVALQAYGGNDANYPGSAGTVYKQIQGQADGAGSLVIDNNNLTSGFFGSPIFSYASALMPTASVWNAAVNLNAFSEIVVTNKGILGVNRDTALTWATAPFRFAGASSSYVSLAGTNSLVLPSALVVSNYTLLIDTPLTAAGNWTVATNATISCLASDIRLQPPLTLTLAGDLTVAAGGLISVESAGFRNNTGPGVGNWSPNRGGSYGGQGGVPSWLPGTTYGSFLAPTNFGSGGVSGGNNLADAGGAIRVAVSGACTVDGTINANAKPGYSGSGGSIYLTVGSLAGSGLLTASGASGAAGGGGRIAVILTNGADFGAVVMRASGGVTPAAAGTVYRETAAQAGGRGVLTIDNNGMTSTTNAVTPLIPGLYAITDELAKATVVITNSARVTLPGNALVGNLFVAAPANTLLDLRSNTLRVKSIEHPLGGGSVTNYGKIIWLPRGSLILIR